VVVDCLECQNYSNKRRVEKLSKIARNSREFFLYLEVVDVVLKHVM
jgi:hypothetical protein